MTGLVRRMASLVATVGVASAVQAQGGSIDAQCRAGTPAERITQDACQKAIDIFSFMAPQLGGGITGGNAVSGEHSVLGRTGRLSIGIRVNAIRGLLPRVDATTVATTGAVATDFGVKEQVLPVPTVDAALGVFRGFPIGGAYAFGVDALVNVAVLTTVNTSDVEVSLPDGPVKLGFGARVSLVAENVFTPGITFTFIRRDLPPVALRGTPGADEIRVDNFRVKTNAWRGVIGKNLGPVAISAGFGQDTYQTTALAAVSVTRLGVTTTSTNLVATQEVTRDNAFGSLALNLGFFSLVAEAGRASGGDLKSFNAFGTARGGDALDYASLGLRVRF